MLFWNTLDVSYIYFKWPWVLLLLALCLILPFLYQKIQKKRWQRALRFSYSSAASHLSHNRSRFKRLLPPLMTLYILFLLIIALSRPTAVVEIPTESVDMMMVVDVSLSMKAKDIQPSRLEAAKLAAKRFIQSLPKDVRVGLIYFAGTSAIQSLPTREHRQIESILDRLAEEDLRPGTALGEGLKDALKAMERRQTLDQQESKKLSPPSAPFKKEGMISPQRVVILISDGDQNTGYPWTVASSQALEESTVVHTVAIGSREVTEIEHEGQFYPVYLDDNTLQQIARITRGSFYRAFKDEDFKAIYEQVRQRAIVFEESHEGMGFIFVGLALFLLLFQQFLLAFWLKRVP